MRKTLLASTMTGILAILLVTACAEDSKDGASTIAAESPTPAEKTEVPAANTHTKNNTVNGNNPIMDEPVDFSTPEAIQKTLKRIQETAGATAAGRLDAAMGYILTYDLGVGHNEERMYKKLNGKTPNQIISMMKR